MVYSMTSTPHWTWLYTLCTADTTVGVEMFPQVEEGYAPAAIAGNIAHILLDVDAHELPNSMGAA